MSQAAVTCLRRKFTCHTVQGSPSEGDSMPPLRCDFRSLPESKSCLVTLVPATGHPERLCFHLVSTSPDPLKYAGHPRALLPEHKHEHSLATRLSAEATTPQHHRTICTSQKYNFCIPFSKSPELGSVLAISLGNVNGP